MPLDTSSINSGRAFACLFADGGSGSTVDEAAGLTLVPAGGASLDGVGLRCDGSGQRAIVAVPPALRLPLPITFAFHGTAQGAPASPSEYFGIDFSSDIAAAPYASCLVGVDGSGRYKAQGNTGGVFSPLGSSTTAVSSGDLVVVAQFEATGWSLYVNGVIVASDTVSRSDPTYGPDARLFLGDHWNVGRDVAMLFKEASIWSRVLTAEERAGYEADPAFGYTATVADPPPGSSGENAGDPARLLVVYNSDLPDSITWADDYAQRRGVPAANRLGVSLALDETIAETAFDSLVDAIGAHLVANGIEDQIVAILCGYGVPGGVFRADGLVDPLAARLQRTDGQTTETTNPLHTGDLGALARPGVADLNGDRVVARIDAPTLADAIALLDHAEALEADPLSGDIDGGGALWLDPYPPDGSVYELRRDQMVDWAASLDRQRLRLPLRLPDDPGGGAEPKFDTINGDGFFWGWTQATPPTDFFGPTAGRRAFAVQLSPDHTTAPTLRSATDESWVARSLAEGYAAAAGSTRAFTASAVPRVEPFFEALRRGWTLGEAWHVASPLLRSGLVLVGDPLMTIAMPRAGWDLYGPFDSIDTAEFDVPVAMLRDDERALALDDSLRIADGERGVYVLRHVDALGRSEAGLRHVHRHRTGNDWHRVPPAPAWPAAEGYRPRRIEGRWIIEAAWAAPFDTLGIERVRLQQQIDNDPPTVVDDIALDAHVSRVMFEHDTPPVPCRYRVVAVSSDGIETHGPWSAVVSPPAAVAPAPLPLI